MLKSAPSGAPECSSAGRIHNTGRAVVWSGHKEPAKLYWENFRGFGLTMAPLERAS